MRARELLPAALLAGVAGYALLRHEGDGTDCGAASAATLQRLVRVGTPITDLKAHARDSGMMSIPEVRSLLVRHGVDAQIPSGNDLSAFADRTPFVAHLTEGHFVVVTKIGERVVSVIDPSFSLRDTFTEPRNALDRRWSGYAIVAN